MSRIGRSGELYRARRTPLIQQQAATSSTTTVTATFAAPTVAGHLLIARWNILSSIVNTTPPTGWTLAVSFSYATGIHLAIYYRIADGTETTVTVSTVGSSAKALLISEYGLMAASPLDLAPVGVGSSGSVTTLVTPLTGTTAQADELIIAVVGTSGNQGTVGQWTNGFTGRYGAANNRLMASDCSVASAGTFSTAPTWQTASVAGAAIAAFKSAA